MPPPQLPILASSVVSLYFLELTDIFQPVHSGYSCSDRSLSLPYILPRQEVCPLPLLFSLAFAAPTATVSTPPPHPPTPPPTPAAPPPSPLPLRPSLFTEPAPGGHPLLLPVQEDVPRADRG